MSLDRVIVDSHFHCSDVWYEPVESMLFQMDRHGVERAVAVQLSAQYDNRYQSECIRRHFDRLTSVVLVDVRREDACDELTRLVEDENAAGIRLGSADRSPGNDPLAIWRRADALGIAVSVSAMRRASETVPGDRVLDAFAELIEEFPTLSFVLEHQGSYERDVTDADRHTREQEFALGRYPNVFMKVGGVGEFAERARPLGDTRTYRGPIPPLHDQAYAAFGADRLMYGSDYPPVAGREGYGGALASCRENYAHLSEAELDAIFGGTAQRIFFKDR